MDSDALREATERWVEEGFLDEDTAAAIQEFELDSGAADTASNTADAAVAATADERPSAGERTDRREGNADWFDDIGVENRLAVALSLMGAVLVGAGVLAYLGSNWESLSVTTRTAILVLAPPVAGGAGFLLHERGFPRVGHACWFLGAALLGPSLFLLGDLHAPDLGAEWLLLGWAVGALPAGHALDSQLTAALGVVATLAAAGAAAPTSLESYVVAFVGVVVVAAGLVVRRRSARLPVVYRVLGLAAVAGVLLALGLQEGDYLTIEPTAEPVLVVAGAAAGLAALAVLAGWSRGSIADADATSVLGATVAAGLAPLVVAVTPPLPGLASFLFVHAVLLGFLVAIVAVAATVRSRALVNLAALAFFLQVTTFLAVTVGETLSGALALIVAGSALLVVGLVLERGRRQLLDRLGIG